ncbi:MAG: hypothetical protein ACI8P9_002859 [Parasphingorhabdus sp.]|jgi:hypothetical protein
MKLLDTGIKLGAESGEDAMVSTASLESRLVALRDQRRDTIAQLTDAKLTRLALDEAGILIELERGDEAWSITRPLFDSLIKRKQWEEAAEACQLMFLSGEEDALAALGQGVWLAVTFPIDPELSLSMLQHIIEETPDNSDGAAVAAATAAYIVDLRCEGKQHNDLQFFSMQMLGNVARRHSNIEDQSQFNSWIARLELDDPAKFLVRLRNVVDVLAQDLWWFDRDLVQQELPVH